VRTGVNFRCSWVDVGAVIPPMCSNGACDGQFEWRDPSRNPFAFEPWMGGVEVSHSQEA